MSDGERRDDDVPTTSAADDDDDEDYEEPGGGNHFLGFMFGNVDDSGDLDADYLDEDAKEHLFALADKLGPSLKDIDLTKSSPAPVDPSEQDYDEKADDAVDYEDIDEEYDGPEVEAATEEDHLLSKKDYFSSNTVFASVNTKASVFDEENYDEDEEPPNDEEPTNNNELPSDSKASVFDEENYDEDEEPPKKHSSVEQLDMSPSNGIPTTEMMSGSLSPRGESMDIEYEVCQDEVDTEEDQLESKSATSLPVLCIEDGSVILKFSEIFGIQEPVRKPKTDHHKRPVSKEIHITSDIVEDDEEVFLRSTIQDLSYLKHIKMNEDVVESDSDDLISSDTFRLKDSCLSEQPMKDAYIDFPSAQQSPVCPDFYPLEHEDWENGIIWGNSPANEGRHCLKSSIISEESGDTQEEEQAKDYGYVSGCYDVQSKNNDSPLITEPFGCTEMPASASYHSPENSYPLLRKETPLEKNNLDEIEPNNINGTAKINTMKCLNNLSLLNKELLEGSWLDNIIWDPTEDTPKPKLIFDLKDDQMLFEILDEKNGDHLRSHARAMIVSRPMKASAVEKFDHSNKAVTWSGQFNISNDNFYSNRKMSQQAKSHTKKRSSMGIKVAHSVPAQKLQTMKPKLSNKEIVNFHRPKAKWYPHENKLAAKLQGDACSHGSMTVIVMTLGGKGVKLVVNAEETPLSVKSKASKKLEFRPSEKIKLFGSGKELQDDISLAMQNVRPKSILHVVRTEVHLWPKAQKLPGEDKPLRPPGAFRKRTDLSVKDGHVFLMEYCEERPLLLANAGMGARLCTYYQKTSPTDQTATSLRSNSDGLGTVLAIEPADKSPFLGDIRSGSHQSCLETNMYRAPTFPHKVASTDYLLVRSPKGMLSLRRIDKLYAVGQQEPHMEVFSPGTKNMQNYLLNRILVYVYREFRVREMPGVPSQIRGDELPIQPPLTEAIVKKRLKHCADLKKLPSGHTIWIQRPDFRIPSEEELRRLLTPEMVCCHESMQAGQHRLKRLGIEKLTQPVGLASAMNQLPDEAIELAAAAHIERELQITSWNLTSNFVACTNQDRENIERLEITGVGDPSGRGLGFSYVRVTPKAPVSNSSHKKKSAAAKGTTVTGTDADLRRLSMDAARELLLKFGVPDEQIDKLTRWHRIAMVRKLSSEQAASGITIDEIPVSKFARGQRMSFLQLQQQTKEKCQEIWDRQIQSLSAIEGDDNGSDTEAHSDLDSFAGDLENLLDAEEFDDEDAGTADMRSDKADGMRGLKMRRCPTQAQSNEEIQDDEAEAALVKKLLEDSGNDPKRKKQSVDLANYGTSMYNQGANKTKQGKAGQMIKSSGYVSALLTPKEGTPRGGKEIEDSFTEGGLPSKLKTKQMVDANDIILVKKKNVLGKDGFKEKRQGARGDSLVCGACGQLGHMRTNKLCPRYGEDPETLEMDALDVVSHVQAKTQGKRLVAKVSSEVPETEGPESIEKIKPVKFRCGAPEKFLERNMSVAGSLVSDKSIMDATDLRSTGKVSKIKICSKVKSEDYPLDTPKPSVVIRPPAESEKDVPRKKVIIKQPKGHVDLQRALEISSSQEPKKIRKIAELSSFEKKNREDDHLYAGEPSQMNSSTDRLGLEGNRKNKEVLGGDESWRAFKEQRERQEQRLIEARIYEANREEELQKAKKKSKKKKKHEFRDDDVLDHRPYRNERKVPERDRTAKRRTPADMTEFAPSAKRRRGGEVELSNILEKIVDLLRENTAISLLFLKPVTKKVAPDYHDIILRPMDLGTIRDKARKMEYKNRDEFRHDVAQIAVNAHLYNDERHPHIPPLADQLLEMCDYLLDESADVLDDAESAIEA
ncbi:transcription initiation factor TFIID subunit 1 isoform X2 [Brachypodium distachyon]|uniref:transcription initiation factor TFIID subunit 1 isoform X2 n=1 Tax=Brachypodium distachyon TaxID=15368 RepID=UPI000234EAA3|nr:transcription initiation factor TFIID subunit 1 isoform X2 [Brachypodium distachyon]|eukprot:XP_003560349.1 transcription initiation factor TFIID subunit 1 isoform X2 [Brachypodium distachyon]